MKNKTINVNIVSYAQNYVSIPVPNKLSRKDVALIWRDK